MKLTPPPRPGRPAAGAPRRAARGRLATLATLAGFAALLAAAVAAFVWLPGWVERRAPLAAPAAGSASGADGAAGGAATAEERAATAGGELTPEAPPPGGGLPVPVREPDVPRPAPPGPSTFTVAPPGAPPAAPAPALAREIGAGLEALERGDPAAARDAFERALAHDPSSRAAADGLTRAESALRLAALLELRSAAATAEEREDWRRALGLYEDALKLDPAVEFALEGRERCARRAELADRLDDYIARAERLASPAVHAEATLFLEMATEIEPAGPRLAARRDRLAELLAGYSEPVAVAITSDGRTAVTVHGVGRLGSFTHRELELRPGTYVVLGTRPGYRDVRRELRVEPGQAPPTLSVRCEEEI